MKTISKKKKVPLSDRLFKLFAFAITLIWIFALLLPMYWMLITTLKDQTAAYKNPPDWYPTIPREYVVDIYYDNGSIAEKQFSNDANNVLWLVQDRFKKINLSSISARAICKETQVAKATLTLSGYKANRQLIWYSNLLNKEQIEANKEESIKILGKEFYFDNARSFDIYKADEKTIEVEKYLNEVKIVEKDVRVSYFDSFIGIFENFKSAWNVPKMTVGTLGMGKYIFNSAFISFLAILGQCLFSSMAAYALSRMLKKRLSNVITFYFLATMMIPGVVTLIPMYLLIENMGLMDTLWAVILPSVPNAFSIYLFKGFFDALPLEVFEAGKIDGASDVRILANIVLPISKPVFGVITMFTFIGSWNDFFWPTLVLKSEDNWTFTIKIFNLINSGTSGGAVDYPTSLAMSLIAAIPTILVFAFFQKQLQKGMVWSGLK